MTHAHAVARGVCVASLVSQNHEKNQPNRINTLLLIIVANVAFDVDVVVSVDFDIDFVLIALAVTLLVALRGKRKTQKR